MSSQRPELSEYQAAADQGRLIRSLSSDGYAIFKYSKEVARDRDWDLVTLTARGHVWDLETETCVATPFDKFFNLNELDDDFVTDFGHPGSRWTEDEIRESIPFEKMDGSLGVVWLDRAGEVRVNTSGAFESEQALWASQWLRENGDVRRRIKEVLTGFGWTTLCVEILSPVSRIVVNYPTDRFGLVLTAVSRGFDTALNQRWASALELESVARGVGLDVVKSGRDALLGMGIEEAIARSRDLEWTEDIEGWVLYHPRTGGRIKIKTSDYLMRHRAVKLIHSNRVKEILHRDGVWISARSKPLKAALEKASQWAADLPEEYRDQYMDFVSEMRAGFDRFWNDAESDAQQARDLGLGTPQLLAEASKAGGVALERGSALSSVCAVLAGREPTVPVQPVFYAAKSKCLPYES